MSYSVISKPTGANYSVVSKPSDSTGSVLATLTGQYYGFGALTYSVTQAVASTVSTYTTISKPTGANYSIISKPT